MSTRAYSSPEEAALSSYSPAAEARVLRIDAIDARHVDVIIDVASSHQMRCHCELTTDGWVETGDIVE